MARWQRIDADDRQRVLDREAELDAKDIDKRNRQAEQWATRHLLNKVVKDVKP